MASGLVPNTRSIVFILFLFGFNFSHEGVEIIADAFRKQSHDFCPEFDMMRQPRPGEVVNTVCVIRQMQLVTG